MRNCAILHPLHLELETARYFKGVAKVALYCAHRTSTFLLCAFCEQEGHLGTPFSSLQAYSLFSRDGGWMIFHCVQHSHPPNPERAGTRSCPRRPPLLFSPLRAR